jgi:hypothetical protein
MEEYDNVLLYHQLQCAALHNTNAVLCCTAAVGWRERWARSAAAVPQSSITG